MQLFPHYSIQKQHVTFLWQKKIPLIPIFIIKIPIKGMQIASRSLVLSYFTLITRIGIRVWGEIQEDKKLGTRFQRAPLVPQQ